MTQTIVKSLRASKPADACSRVGRRYLDSMQLHANRTAVARSTKHEMLHAPRGLAICLLRSNHARRYVSKEYGHSTHCLLRKIILHTTSAQDLLGATQLPTTTRTSTPTRVHGSVACEGKLPAVLGPPAC